VKLHAATEPSHLGREGGALPQRDGAEQGLILPFNAFDQTVTLPFDRVTNTDYPITLSTSRFFMDVAFFVSYVNALCAASSYPRVRTVSFAFDSATSRLTMTDTGGSVRPKPYDDGPTTGGNSRIGFPGFSRGNGLPCGRPPHQLHQGRTR